MHLFLDILKYMKVQDLFM